jgi:hypothetical protein
MYHLWLKDFLVVCATGAEHHQQRRTANQSFTANFLEDAGGGAEWSAE